MDKSYAHPKEETWPYAKKEERKLEKRQHIAKKEKQLTKKEKQLTKKEKLITRREKQLEKRQHAVVVANTNLLHQLACAQKS